MGNKTQKALDMHGLKSVIQLTKHPKSPKILRSLFSNQKRENHTYIYNVSKTPKINQNTERPLKVKHLQKTKLKFTHNKIILPIDTYI